MSGPDWKARSLRQSIISPAMNSLLLDTTKPQASSASCVGNISNLGEGFDPPRRCLVHRSVSFPEGGAFPLKNRDPPSNHQYQFSGPVFHALAHLSVRLVDASTRAQQVIHRARPCES